jgi:3-hydroxymyristoyl/3-hydroxydecanoyl-(acyl carrier protein) dehydratase
MSGYVVPLSIGSDHPAYAGHFPGRPILPGAVLLDEAVHALMARLDRVNGPWHLKSVKFHSPVLPGEALILYAAESPAGGCRFEIRCRDARGNERSVASGAVVLSRAATA